MTEDEAKTTPPMVRRVAEALIGPSFGMKAGEPVSREEMIRFVEPQARAAIRAMREPTRKMIVAADRLADFNSGDDSLGYASPNRTYRAMIDAALGEK